MSRGALRVYLAVDLGAPSGCVHSGTFDGSRLWVKEVRRFPLPMRSGAGPAHPDVPALFLEVKRGLALAARAHGPCIRSLGVQSPLTIEPVELGPHRSLPDLFSAWLCGGEGYAQNLQTDPSSARPGRDLGELQLEIAQQTGLRGVRVVHVASEGEAPDVLGSLLVQMIADGAISNLEEGREALRRSVPPDAPFGAHSG